MEDSESLSKPSQWKIPSRNKGLKFMLHNYVIQMSGSSSTESMSSETKICNTCLDEKPLTSFKINGTKTDGSKYRTNKCRDCLESKKSVLHDDDRAVIARALSIAEKALSITDKVLTMTI